MTLAIDVIDGHGLSNQVHREFLPAKEELKDVLPVYTTNRTYKKKLQL